MEKPKKKRLKYGGRRPGSKNKHTLLMEQSMEKHGVDPIEGLKDCLKELDGIEVYEPGDKISLVNAKSKIYLELIQYIYPKRKAMDINKQSTTNEVKHIDVDVEWADETEKHDSKNAASDAPPEKDQ